MNCMKSIEQPGMSNYTESHLCSDGVDHGHRLEEEEARDDWEWRECG